MGKASTLNGTQSPSNGNWHNRYERSNSFSWTVCVFLSLRLDKIIAHNRMPTSTRMLRENLISFFLSDSVHHYWSLANVIRWWNRTTRSHSHFVFCFVKMHTGHPTWYLDTLLEIPLAPENLLTFFHFPNLFYTTIKSKNIFFTRRALDVHF